MSQTPLDYALPERRWFPPLPWRGIAWGIVIVLAILVPVVLHHERTVADRVDRNNCRYNCGDIARAVFEYADLHGVFPPDFQAVLAMPSHSPFSVVCPATSDIEPKRPADVAVPGHCSYVYVGSALTKGCGLDCVIAFEDPANHGLRGGHVIRVAPTMLACSFCDMPSLTQIINDLAAGKNPPSTSTRLTQAMAEDDYKTNWRSRMTQFKSNGWQVPSTRPSTGSQ